ncbi:phospholipid/cholesterol/gamma-HCH transport system substrate-binding protein [Rhodococcus sp. 27YEA15]|uniref:MCE family protein n=1 Tax=Rhodococcus sp. 27YEA15 TaxID=3156259 RepID=UPI003C7AAE7C
MSAALRAGGSRRRVIPTILATVVAASTASCGWAGVNSLPLPGTEGVGEDSYTVTIEMPDVSAVQQNSRVRVSDVTVGTVTSIKLEDWHALVTVSVNGSVVLPANTVAKVGQTSLLGTLHLELAPPLGEAPVGALADGDRIPLSRAGQYPTTEQTLASVSTVLNGGGLGRLQEINTELNAAMNGREGEIRSFLTQLDVFIADVDRQKNDIIYAMDGMDRLAAEVVGRTDTMETALEAIPPALAVLAEQREQLARAIGSIGGFADVSHQALSRSFDDIAANLGHLGPVMREIADAGPALLDGLDVIPAFPWSADGIEKFIRGDAGNLSAVIDLTLGRIDNGLLQGTPFDASLTAIETAMGRTEGRQPSPSTTTNPLTAPGGPLIDRGER